MTLKYAASRHSGLQLDIFGLYRRILRLVVKKDRDALGSAAHSLSFTDLLFSKNNNMTNYASSEFRRQAATVKRSDFKTIEYMMRKANKHAKVLSMPGAKIVRGTSSMT
jgi:hypothetical protein